MQRSVEPEWGDRIPADDPRALRLRQDLQHINALAKIDQVLADALLCHHGDAPPRSMLDLGAGDGTVMLRTAQRLAPRWKDVSVILLDQQNFVTEQTREGFSALGWKAETVADDVFRFLRQARPEIDIITANGFLHHFREPQLAELLELAARLSRLIVAADPRRTRLCLRLSWFAWVMGYSSLFRRDLTTSIKAGFKYNEISALGPRDANWVTQESEVGSFIHLFVAKRRVAA